MSAQASPGIFLREDGLHPYGPQGCEPEPATLEGESEEVVQVLRRLLQHSGHAFDLSGMDGVREALEMLREELRRGDDLPVPGLEGLRELLVGIARPPEIPMEAPPLPAPRPAPEPRVTARVALQALLAPGVTANR